MEINLQRLFFSYLSVVIIIFVLLCVFKNKTKNKAVFYIGDVLRYACLQCFVSLVFLAVYILYIKNGYVPSLADIGVAMLPFSVFVFWLAWRFKALCANKASLLYPLCYSLFLVYKFFSVERDLRFFGYVLLNPIYGFIGSQLLESKLRPLAAVSALLPFACCCLAYGLARKKN